MTRRQSAYRVVINERRSFRGGCPWGYEPGDLLLRRVGASAPKH